MLQVLIRLLQSAEPIHRDARPAAVAALPSCGMDAASAAVPVLNSLLSDADNAVRRETLRVLGWLEADARLAVPAIIQQLVAEREPDIRHEAVLALVQCDPGGEVTQRLCINRQDQNQIMDSLRALGASFLAEEARGLRRKLTAAWMELEETVSGARLSIRTWAELT